MSVLRRMVHPNRRPTRTVAGGDLDMAVFPPARMRAASKFS